VNRALALPTLARLYLLPASAAEGVPADPRIAVIEPAFDSMLFKPAAKDRRLVLRTMAGLPQNDPIFLIDLACRLPNHRVVLAIARAVDFDGMPDEMRAYAAAIGSPIEFANDLPRRAVAELIARAGIFVHTHPTRNAALNKRVGGPVSVAEAMATGAYLVVRDLRGLVDYVGDAGAAYADLDHAAALIRETESWTDAEWQAAQRRSIERAFTRHADETALAPIFEDWCELVRQRDAARAMPVAAS
jgi:glycosyltransferase involved in cell wall biosynthesis